MDEVFIRIGGKQHCLWRAVDQDGHVLDILVQSRRNTKRPGGSSASFQVWRDVTATATAR